MADVAVLIPYRPDPARDPLLAYVQQWWATTQPAWPVLVGRHDDGPWCKAAAVADALAQAGPVDLLVVADADVLCDGISRAADRVTEGAPWAIPHRRVYRLTPDATAAVLAGGPMPPLPGPAKTGRRHPTQPRRQVIRPRTGPIVEYHAGAGGGGMTVLPRDLYARVPLDPRFRGWGQEDTAWAAALTALAGRPWRGDRREQILPPMWHLWHPPQERSYPAGRSQSRAIGSAEGLALARRYRAATRTGSDAVAALLAEFAGPTTL